MKSSRSAAAKAAIIDSRDAKTGAPTKFSGAFKAFLSGACDLSAVRRDLARDICISPAAADAIERMLDEAREDGRLKGQHHRILIEDVRRITTEEAPTAPPTSPPTSPPTVTDAVPRPKAPAESAHEPETGLGSILKGRYQLEELVSDGPMGKVFRASDLLKREADANPSVAIKMLSAELRTDHEALARLQQEAFQVQRLNHPNIINVFDYDRDGNIDYIAMEWLEGETLASVLDSTCPEPLPLEEARRIATATVAGISCAHAHDIVHGDVKPANICLGRDESIRIFDFGTVRGRAVKSAHVTGAAFAMTPGYASCELLEGSEPCAQDDVYALACTIYRMLAGHRPYGTSTALQAEAEGQTTKRPDALTESQWQVLSRGLEFRRDNRLLDVDALLDVFVEEPAPARRTGWRLPATLALLVGLATGAIAPTAFDLLRSRVDPGVTFDAITEVIPGDRAEAPPAPAVIVGPAPAEIVSAPEIEPPIAESPEPTIEPTIEPSMDAPIDAPVAPTPAATMPEIDEPAVVPVVAAPAEGPAPAAAPGIAEPDEAPIPRASAPLSQEASPPDPAVTGTPPTVGPTGLASRRLEVSEGDGFIRLVITAPANLTSKLPVRIALVDGSATEGDDYLTPARTLLEFGPGVTQKVVFVPLIADAIGEHIEEFGISLEGVDQALTLDNTAMLVIVVDDDVKPLAE